MSQISINKKDVFWAYVGTFFRVCTNIILLPIIIYFLSGEELGLWYVFASIAQLVILLDFGFAPTFARNIAYVWCGARSLQKQNIEQVEDNTTDLYEFKSIIETCKLLYLAIAIISSIILFTAGSFYVVKVSSQEYLWVWLVYAIAVAINILYSYYTSLLRGVGAIAENNIAAVASKVIHVVFSVLFLYLGYGLMGLSIAYLLSGLTLRIFSKVLFERYEKIGEKLKGVKIRNKLKICIDRVKILWYNASRDGLVTLSNYLSSHANTLICSYAISLTITGAYGLSIQIATIVGIIAGIPFSVYQAQMQEGAVSGNVKSNTRVFSRSMFQYVISFILMSLLSYVCIPILRFIKPELEFDLSMFTMILVQFFIFNYYSLFGSFISSYNTLPYVRAYVISSFASVVLSTALVYLTGWGVWALIISPIIVSLYNLWKWPHYVRNRLIHVSFVQFYKEGYHETIEQIRTYIKKRKEIPRV